jgi:putative effector of murein hydrolase
MIYGEPISPALWHVLDLLLPLPATVLAYEAGLRLQRRCKGNALANPVLIAVVSVSVLLSGISMPAADYAAGVQPLALLLGPATVALAVTIYRSLPKIREAIVAVLVSVVAAGTLAASAATGLAALMGTPAVVVHSIATKSATAAIAMAVSSQIGGEPSLAAGLSVITGIAGAVMCSWVLNICGVRDRRAQGLATGIAAHGIGTARMLGLDAEAGAFAGLGMSLTGLATGFVLPLVYAAM